MPDVTPIVIGLDGAFAICAVIAGGMFGVWRASANAHEDIRAQLCDIRERLARIEERVGIEMKGRD